MSANAPYAPHPTPRIGTLPPPPMTPPAMPWIPPSAPAAAGSNPPLDDAPLPHLLAARIVVAGHDAALVTQGTWCPVRVPADALASWEVRRVRRGVFLGARTVASVDLLPDLSVVVWQHGSPTRLPAYDVRPPASLVRYEDVDPAETTPLRRLTGDTLARAGMCQDDAAQAAEVMMGVWAMLRWAGACRDARVVLRVARLLQVIGGED